MFNWENVKVFDQPYKYAICDNFLSFYVLNKIKNKINKIIIC